MRDTEYTQRMQEILTAPPIKHLPREPTEVLPHVFIGNQSQAENYKILRKFGITHVINCAGYRGPRNDPDLVTPYEDLGIDYLEIKAEDREGYDIVKHFNECFHYLDNVKRKRGKALVHCAMGINRSGAICLGYLMQSQRTPLLYTVQNLRKKRNILLVNRGFQRQLVHFAKLQGLLDDLEEDPIRENDFPYTGPGAYENLRRSISTSFRDLRDDYDSSSSRYRGLSSNYGAVPVPYDGQPSSRYTPSRSASFTNLSPRRSSISTISPLSSTGMSFYNIPDPVPAKYRSSRTPSSRRSRSSISVESLGYEPEPVRTRGRSRRRRREDYTTHTTTTHEYVPRSMSRDRRESSTPRRPLDDDSWRSPSTHRDRKLITSESPLMRTARLPQPKRKVKDFDEEPRYTSSIQLYVGYTPVKNHDKPSFRARSLSEVRSPEATTSQYVYRHRTPSLVRDGSWRSTSIAAAY